MNGLVYEKVVNEDEHIRCLLGKRAECVGDSLEVWWKLRNLNPTPTRVRGKRNLEREVDMKENSTKNYHFWVESKGYVFEEHAGVRQILKCEDYYKYKSITAVEKAPYKCFFANELPSGYGDTLFEMNDLQLLHLINIYKDKQDKI